ncbi:hypothetical protein E2C01_086583 [Portunus trituberculatus]|uniref:Uncharacterized protein n=1 Tax=Portunus trituberculatus TaxID=210409 RepID=A0A5B7JEZ9_PORTR|nr:hypothetical protein [Portunus trituberculatus]
MGERSADTADEVGDALAKCEAVDDSILIDEVEGPVDEVDGLATCLKKDKIVDCFAFVRFASYNSR